MPTRRDILNGLPSYDDAGLTRPANDPGASDRTIEGLIELYLASRRADRAAEAGGLPEGSQGGERSPLRNSMVLDGLLG